MFNPSDNVSPYKPSVREQLENVPNVTFFDKKCVPDYQYMRTVLLGSSPAHCLRFVGKAEYPYVLCFSKDDRVRRDGDHGMILGYHRRTMREVEETVQSFARCLHTKDLPHPVALREHNRLIKEGVILPANLLVRKVDKRTKRTLRACKFPRVTKPFSSPNTYDWTKHVAGAELVNVDTQQSYTFPSSAKQTMADLKLPRHQLECILRGQLVFGWRLKN